MIARMSDWDDGLGPGQLRLISEGEWFEVLESAEPLHQWGPALLVEDGGPDGLLRLWLRDDEERRHRVIRLDAAATVRARQGLAEIEQAGDRVADLLAAERERGSSTTAQVTEQHDASEAYVQVAEALYRELAASGRAIDAD